ncbi:MAG: CBS domain-containing protein [Methanomicrobiales archaeon]|nr:CBS domain-containing protein [Methanomicrobiales archaeon]
MPLDDCCQKTVVTVAPDASVHDVIGLMEGKNVGCVVVTEGKKPVGIITDRDIVIRVVSKNGNTRAVKAKDAMTKNPFCLPGSTGVFDALKQMKGKRFRRIPVTDAKGNLSGIITIDDFTRLLVKELSFISSIIEEQSPGF